MNLRTFLLLAVFVQLFSSCSKNDNTDSPSDLQIAVFSDPHYYDPTLGVTGSAFESYLVQDRKMLVQSKLIAESLVQTLKTSSSSIVLVTGDLTKDGEKSNHEKMVELLNQLKSAGKRVFVIPGNHDINNPDAASFSGAVKTKIPSVTPAEFATLYNQFGYGEALYRDANSLSYVVSLNSNTWLLAMDACRYKENVSSPITGGKFSDATYQWIKDRLTEAKSKNIKVLGMSHHGMLEHFVGQSQVFPEYLVENWANVSSELAGLGLKVVFTGHFHAQDIVRKDVSSSSFIFDVETGSLVTWPAPYRTMTYTTTNKLSIHTGNVTSIAGYTNFADFSKTFIQQGLDTLCKLQLTSAPYNLPYQQAKAISPLMVSSFMAHYHGDEAIDATTQAGLTQMKAMGGAAAVLGSSLQSLSTDTAPADQNIEIDLNTGVVTPL